VPTLNGRKPKPRHLRLVEGNRGKRAAKKPAPSPQAGTPPRPTHIARNAIARGEWDRLVGLTTAKSYRVLTVADGPILEATVTAYAQMRAAQLVVDAKGATYTTRTQTGSILYRQRPEVLIATDAWRRYVLGLTHFGLSPAMRAKVQILDDGDQAKDPAETFLE